ncbi:hypothetical protein Tco_1367581 [Tanacetum coccineum]
MLLQLHMKNLLKVLLKTMMYKIQKEEVYVYQPPGFVDPDHPNNVYKERYHRQNIVYNEELVILEQTATEGKLKENQGCRVDTDQVHQNEDLKNRSV